LLIAHVQTPFRFRGKRQFWAYCGLALETRSSADYRWVTPGVEVRPNGMQWGDTGGPGGYPGIAVIGD
jgi:hypothetical protein